MVDTEPLRTERREHAVVITLNRPDRMNALSRAMVAALGNLGRELAGDPEVRAVVLTGAGTKAFCAGADLKERRGMTDDDVRKQLASYRSELSWLADFRAPVVAAINGACLGGGLEVALLCDLRVAASHAQLGLPETSLGIIPGAGGTQRLPRLIGEARAKEMILLARRLSADEAFALGLVNRICQSADIVEDTLRWMAPILKGAPIAQRAALQAIDAASETTLNDGLARELELYDECLRSEDRLEALRAFSEKRSPDFRGR